MSKGVDMISQSTIKVSLREVLSYVDCLYLANHEDEEVAGPVKGYRQELIDMIKLIDNKSCEIDPEQAGSLVERVSKHINYNMLDIKSREYNALMLKGINKVQDFYKSKLAHY